MSKLHLLLSGLLLAGCASNPTRLHLDDFAGMRFLSPAELAATQAALPTLRFPLSRAEAFRQLKLPTDARWVETYSTVNTGGHDTDTLHLTNPRVPGANYTLVLECDPAVRTLNGEARASARVILSARIVTGLTPEAAAR